jgi:hypothetical protein
VIGLLLADRLPGYTTHEVTDMLERVALPSLFRLRDCELNVESSGWITFADWTEVCITGCHLVRIGPDSNVRVQGYPGVTVDVSGVSVTMCWLLDEIERQRRALIGDAP